MEKASSTQYDTDLDESETGIYSQRSTEIIRGFKEKSRDWVIVTLEETASFQFKFRHPFAFHSDLPVENIIHYRVLRGEEIPAQFSSND